jgi:hypothetical protein
LRGAGLLFFFLNLAGFKIFDLFGFEDFDFEVLEDAEDVIDFLLVFDRVGEGFVYVVEGEVALLFREADESADFIVNPTGREIIERVFGGFAFVAEGVFGFQGRFDGIGVEGSSGSGEGRLLSFARHMVMRLGQQGVTGVERRKRQTQSGYSGECKGGA